MFLVDIFLKLAYNTLYAPRKDRIIIEYNKIS